jgi:phage terminase large subunit-like protein
MSGGATTGFRGDRILIDDANNPLDVESDTVRATTNIWLREVMPSRVNHAETSAIINIQQRTHEEDATGILAKYGGGYRWTCVPMHYDPLRDTPVPLTFDEDGRPVDVWHDPRGVDPDTGKRLEGLFADARSKVHLRPGSPLARADGALAWPERWSQEACDKIRNTLGPYAYENQYQQSPGVRGGSIIRRDWWQVWEGEYPDMGTVIAVLDTAIEENEKNDWNALITLGAFPGKEGEPKVMLTSAAKWRCQLSELVTNVRDVCVYRKVDYLLIERKTRGKDVHDEIVRLYAAAPWNTVLVEVFGTKVSRLSAVSHLFSGDLTRDRLTGIDVYSGGIVYAPDRDWSDEVIDQVTAFPTGAHDDFVDCLSMGMGWIRKNGVVLRRVEWDERELERKQFRKSIGVPYAIRR